MGLENNIPEIEKEKKKDATQPIPRRNPLRKPTPSREEESVEQVSIGASDHVSRPKAPLSSSERSRQEILALTLPMQIDIAEVKDAQEIANLYHSLEYKNSAFQTIAKYNAEEFSRIMNMPPDTPERKKLMEARDVFRGGGVFSPTGVDEWIRRIITPGEEVLIFREIGKEKIIGIHSYYLGKDHPQLIESKIQSMGEHVSTQGKIWMKSSLPEKNPYDKVIMVRDSMIDSSVQGRRMVLRFLLEMMKREKLKNNLSNDELSQWFIMYYVNHFHEVTTEPYQSEKEDHSLQLMGIQSNRATVRATESLGCYQIGTTLPSKGNLWKPVMRLDGSGKQLLMENEDGSEGKPIFVKIGDLDYVIPVAAKLVEYIHKTEKA